MEPIVVLGFMIIIAGFLAFLLKTLKQPPLAAYLIAGILLIPIKAMWSVDTSELTDLLNVSQKLGIILLLFMAGLEIRLQKIKQHLKSSLVLSISQIVITTTTILILGIALFGHTTMEAFYIGIAIALSSTIVVVKTLTMRKELHTTHGQILIGIMIIQDIVALITLTFLSSFNSGNGGMVLSMYLVFMKACATFCLLLLISRGILVRLFDYIANSIEEVFLIGMAWCFAGVLVAFFFQFSIELGAFIAGLTIASLPFSFEIRDKARSLRDFGLLLLFISVGSSIVIPYRFSGDISGFIAMGEAFFGFLAALFSYLFFSIENWVYMGFAILGSFFIFNFFTNILGFEKKQGFLISAIPSQISEFSIVIISYGFINGNIDAGVFSKITLITVVSIILSSILLTNLNWFFKRFNHLIFFHHLNPNRHRRSMVEHDFEGHVIIFGMGQLGNHIAEYFLKKHKNVIVVDWMPEKVKHAHRIGCSIMYGDAGDPDVWEETRAEHAAVIVNTINQNQEDDINFIEWIKKKGKKPKVVAETNSLEDEMKLKALGYDLVLMPQEMEWEALNIFLKRHGL